jgi:hypothetical protein
MREAAKVKADLQKLLAKIQAAVTAAEAANKGSVTNYAAGLEQLAGLITQATQKELGEGSPLVRETGELLKTMEREGKSIKEKSEDLRDPGHQWYGRMLPGLNADIKTLEEARSFLAKCREDLVAEAKRLHSISAVVATAARLEQLHNAVEAFTEALTETAHFTARLKSSIDSLLASATAPRVAVE